VPRIRTFKAELFIDDKITECSVDARFLFLGLLPHVDDMGRRQYHPRRIKGEVFPCDEEFTPQVVEGLIQELAKTGIIELYEIGKQRYLRIPNFLRHQVINRPGHCYYPPSPSEGKDAVRCNCPKCKSKQVDSSDMFPQELDESSLNNHGVLTEDSLFTEHSVNVHGGLEGKGVERSKNKTNTNTSNSNSAADQTQGESNGENRRTPNRPLDEIAMRVLKLLEIAANQLIFESLTRSIKVKARSKNCSYELAAQTIAARAAYFKTEAPPENWEAWFADAAYEYVPQGDARLQDRRIEARPVCGGPRCTEGWEQVQVNGHAILRRCPQCAQLWADLGV
jgi:hypothetical protein